MRVGVVHRERKKNTCEKEVAHIVLIVISNTAEHAEGNMFLTAKSVFTKVFDSYNCESTRK